MNKSTENQKPETEKTLHCPFHKGLACEDCRLFKRFSKNQEKQCIFITLVERSF